MSQATALHPHAGPHPKPNLVTKSPTYPLSVILILILTLTLTLTLISRYSNTTPPQGKEKEIGLRILRRRSKPPLKSVNDRLLQGSERVDRIIGYLGM